MFTCRVILNGNGGRRARAPREKAKRKIRINKTLYAFIMYECGLLRRPFGTAVNATLFRTRHKDRYFPHTMRALLYTERNPTWTRVQAGRLCTRTGFMRNTYIPEAFVFRGTRFARLMYTSCSARVVVTSLRNRCIYLRTPVTSFF